MSDLLETIVAVLVLCVLMTAAVIGIFGACAYLYCRCWLGSLKERGDA